MYRRLSWCVACLLLVGLLACVSRERSEVLDAREAYARCVEEHSARHPDCLALQERVRSTEERYRKNAERAWGCDPAHPDCPTPR